MSTEYTQEQMVTIRKIAEEQRVSLGEAMDIYEARKRTHRKSQPAPSLPRPFAQMEQLNSGRPKPVTGKIRTGGNGTATQPGKPTKSGR